MTPNSSDSDDENWCSGSPDFPGENMPCASTVYCAPHIGDAHATSRSRHIGGVQIVLADGSVHFVEDSISVDVWRALATIVGEENRTKF